MNHGSPLIKKEEKVSFFKKEKEEGNASELDVQTQLKKIADHLAFLEKKLDMLLSQSRNRGPAGFRNANDPRARDPRDHYRSGNRSSYSWRNPGQGQGNREGGHRPPRHGHHPSRTFQKNIPQNPTPAKAT